ncbi:TonB-dependent receptor domain-containing protein [Elizabethkingia meningoseptica]|uniref:TonB-dependent receptor domain-containing protein n=1 Tax=Elizabethkingia meningoseptica TaxID=238 RepID=UPI0023AED554|nr:TonB-dependent receptor [Elizabethkingia meningoseptica]MDE5491442.1 TonB-dependent receptor [Elizabethkingia meningoseptica]
MKSALQKTLFLTLCTTGALVMAQEFKGKIFNSETGEVVTGAEVQIFPGKQKVFSGLDGEFKFKNLSPGQYTYTITYNPFRTIRKTILIADEKNEIEVFLGATGVKEIEIINIKVNKKADSDAFARKAEQKLPQVTNIVSGASISKSPDISVANVIQRVSGVSVERSSNGEGQYAILRGMDKRYNYTLVNDVKIPSPDGKNRYIPLDIFPAELLDRLEIYKSLLPNMEGDAVGGVVNMVMKDAPSREEINVNLALGYSQMLFDKKFKTFPTDQINFRSPYELNGKSYQANNSNFPKNNYRIENVTAMPNFSGGFSYGKRFFNQKLGFIGAVSFQNNNRLTESQFFNSNNVDVMKYAVITSLNDRNYYENQQRLGIHTKLDYKINKNHSISLYNLFAQLRETQLRENLNTNFSNSVYNPQQGNASLSYQNRTRLQQQRVWNSTLKGEHKLVPGLLNMDWSAVVSSASNELPDTALFGTLGVRRNFAESHTSPTDASRSWQRNTDNDYAGYLNFGLKLNKATEIKAGGLYRDKKRSSFYNNYVLKPVNPTAQWGTDYNDYTGIDYEVQNPKGAVANPLTYDATEKIAAAYLMLDTRIENLHISGGLRMENTDQGYKLYFPQGESKPEMNQKYTDYLPSLSLKYTLNHNQNFRATYFRSVNRPGFYEIVPSRMVYEEFQERGNPDLKRALADNLDFRYEFFPNATDQYMIGVFHKTIKDPIEYTLQPDPTRPQDTFYSPGNFGTAHNYGLEVDVIKFFNKIGIKANYTFTNSTIETPKSQKIRNQAGDLETIQVMQKRPLYGQSKHIANLSLLYKDVKNGWDAQLAGSYTGDRINIISQYLDNDIWQKGFVQLDFSLEKKLKNGVTIFLKANNLLNTPMELFIKGSNPENQNIPYQKVSENETLIRKDYYKQTYLLGVKFKI